MATFRFDGAMPVTSFPPIRILPRVTSSSPEIRRSMVDFPQPDGPTRTMNSPSGISRSTPSMASTVPKDFATPSSTSDAISNYSPLPCSGVPPHLAQPRR